MERIRRAWSVNGALQTDTGRPNFAGGQTLFMPVHSVTRDPGKIFPGGLLLNFFWRLFFWEFFWFFGERASRRAHRLCRFAWRFFNDPVAHSINRRDTISTDLAGLGVFEEREWCSACRGEG